MSLIDREGGPKAFLVLWETPFRLWSDFIDLSIRILNCQSLHKKSCITSQVDIRRLNMNSCIRSTIYRKKKLSYTQSQKRVSYLVGFILTSVSKHYRLYQTGVLPSRRWPYNTN
uniref:Uncharacterized protein n=1 Tax=Cacopsylla melanoneura TaxID=428564 RepID=A0A8D9BQ59_9HEMI